MTIDPEWRELGPRTLLFVPGDRAAELWRKAQRSGADAVIVDLEDAVLPDRKADARSGLVGLIADDGPRVPSLLRVNAATTPWFAEDIAAGCAAGFDGVIVAKAEDPEDIRRAAAIAATAGCGDSFVILPLLESAKGVLAAADIATAAPGVVGLAIGAEDLALDLGVRRTAGGREILLSRSSVVLAVAAAGRTWAIDTPCLELRRADAVRRDAAIAGALGLTGKLIIHPAQVRPVHEAFRPSESQIEAATKIIRGSASTADSGRGIAVEDGRMIDRPVSLAAERVLRRAARAVELAST